MASIGAILSLDAVGKHDTYLDSPDPRDSLFHYKLPERHAKFAHYHKVTTISRPRGDATSWPFSATVTTILNPQELGDYLTGITLRIPLPTLPDAQSRLTTYCNKVGWHFINNLNIKIDEVDILSVYGDTLMLDYELNMSSSEKRASDVMLGGDTADAHNVTVKIPTGFTKSTPLPLCAIHRQKLRVSIDFNPVSFFSDTGEKLDIKCFDIITGLVDIDPFHRLTLIDAPIERVFTTLVRQPVFEIPEQTRDTKHKYNLVGSDSVRAFIWFLRRDVVEQVEDITHFDNRFNLSNSPARDSATQNLNPILDNAEIFINSQSNSPPVIDPTRKDISTRNFYKFNRRFYVPTRDIFSFCHSLYPDKEMPTGMLDMSKTNSNGTFLQMTLNHRVSEVVQLHVYFLVDKRYKIERGHLTAS